MDSTLRGERRKLTLAELQHLAGAVAHLSSGTGSEKVRRTGPEKARSPLSTRADSETLERYASAATSARGKRKNDRKQLRFPPLRRVYAKGRYSAEGEQLSSGASYCGDVWDYLQAWAFRTLNDLQGAGYLPPSHEHLAEAGDVFGLDSWTVTVQADLRHDWSGELDAAQKAAAGDGRPHAAVIGYRTGQRLASEQFVMLTLSDFAAVLRQAQKPM